MVASYDVLYNDMNSEQRATVRKAFAEAIKGRMSYGMNEPRGKAVSNHYGYHGDLALFCAAIEGEEGYDDATYRRIAQVLTDCFTVGLTPEGACHEDTYGPTVGMREGSRGLMVLARRGRNLFSTPRYRDFVAWMAQSLEPFPAGNMVGGASGVTGRPYPGSVVIAKYMFPKDPVADYVYRWFVGDDYKSGLRWQGFLDYAIFGMPYSSDPCMPNALADTDIPLSAFYPRRGKLISRNDWSPETLCFHLDARPDAKHEYTWYVQLAKAVEIDPENGSDIFLKDPKDNRRLVVRVLHPTHVHSELESHKANKDRMGKPIMGKRLLISCRTVAPPFRVFLFPHRRGTKLPVTSWKQTPKCLEVMLPGRQDEIRFVEARDGSVRPSLMPGPSASETNIHLRGQFQNARIKFENEKKGHVAFIGGSITEMNGYRPMVMDILKRHFPETEFTFTDAGISSTCSTTGAFRLQDHVLSKGPVDLFFVEFAVNDDQDAHHTYRDCIRGMEGIVRRTRLHNPDADIVITYFVNPEMLEKWQSGEVPLSVGAHREVAQYYRISTINLAKEVADRITSGKLTWKQFGGTHPKPFGNAICASMIDSLMSEAWKEPLPANAESTAHKLPEHPLDEKSYWRGRLIAPDKAKIISYMSVKVPDWSSIKGNCRSRFANDRLLCASEPGAEMTLDFEGTAIGAYVLAGPDAGIVETRIDGGPYKPFDLFHHYSAGLHYPRTIVFDADLRPGRHTLRLRIVENRDERSIGNMMRVLYFVAN
jgi:lysophospholipase L1-like esterase